MPDHHEQNNRIRPYLGVDLGLGFIQTPDSGDNKLNDPEKKPFAYGLRAGLSFPINKQFSAGFEVSYARLGSVKSDRTIPNIDKFITKILNTSIGNIKTTASVIDFIGTFKYHTGKFFVGALLGLALSQEKHEATFELLSVELTNDQTSASKLEPEFGLLFGYEFTPNVSLDSRFKFILGDKENGGINGDKDKFKPYPVIGLFLGVTYTI